MPFHMNFIMPYVLFTSVRISSENFRSCGIQSAIKEVVGDIFGCQQGSTFSEGLVGSNSDEEFNEKLCQLEERWKQFEAAHNVESSVHDWFVQYKARVMKATTIKSIREEACLGIPPEQFTTNASETIN